MSTIGKEEGVMTALADGFVRDVKRTARAGRRHQSR